MTSTAAAGGPETELDPCGGVTFVEASEVVGREVVAEGNAGIRTRRSERELRHADRRRQAIELRLSGATFSVIGERLGISEQGASKLYRAAIRSTYAAAGSEALGLELHRCDEITARWWPRLLDPDDLVADRATRNLLRAMAHRADLLGLKVTKLDVQVAGGVTIPADDEVWEALREMRRAAADEQSEAVEAVVIESKAGTNVSEPDKHEDSERATIPEGPISGAEFHGAEMVRLRGRSEERRQDLDVPGRLMG